MSIQETIAPLGHTIIALSSPPNGESGAEDSITAWIDHLNSVSDPINRIFTIRNDNSTGNVIKLDTR